MMAMLMWIRLGAGSGAAAVLLGAFGAHGLKTHLAAAADGATRLGWWQTGAHYHLVHSVAVLAVSLWLAALLRPMSPTSNRLGATGDDQPRRRGTLDLGVGRLRKTWAYVALAAWCLGIVIFSGTLYVMALTGWRWLGAITPVGGLLLTMGWLVLTTGVRVQRVRGSD